MVDLTSSGLLKSTDAPTEDSLNELGREGWELVIALPIAEGKVLGVNKPNTFIFKRQLE